MDGTTSGWLPVSANAVSQEQSRALSLRCCAWLLSHGARGGEQQRAKPAEAKIFTAWPRAEETCQAGLTLEDCMEVRHDNNWGSLRGAG